MFAYKVVPGRSGQSYGLKVAALADMPAAMLTRAAELLAQHTRTKQPVRFETESAEVEPALFTMASG